MSMLQHIYELLIKNKKTKEKLKRNATKTKQNKKQQKELRKKKEQKKYKKHGVPSSSKLYPFLVCHNCRTAMQMSVFATFGARFCCLFFLLDLFSSSC
jgi:membrane protein insertase Oxa1/YidC/SpoIIIJ